MAVINIRRRHDEDGQYRASCLRKVAYYDGLRAKYTAWVDTLSREQLLAIAHATSIRDMEGLKEAVLRSGLADIETETRYWARMAEARLDPLAYV